MEISGGHERDPLHLLMAKKRAAAEPARSARREAYGCEVGTGEGLGPYLEQMATAWPGLQLHTVALSGCQGVTSTVLLRALSNTGIQRRPRKKRLNKLRLAGCAVRYSDVRLLDKFYAAQAIFVF